jgi:predicted nucleotidyltransferase
VPRAPRKAIRSTPASSSAARFLLRLPSELHRALAKQAAHEQVSLNEHCVQRLGGPDLPFLPRRDAAAVLARARAVTGRHCLGVIVHGSWARGEALSTSDVDLLVVVARGLPLARSLYRIWDAEAPTWEGRPVDAHFVHLPDASAHPSSIWCEAAIDGLVLADTAGDVSLALVRVRTAIAHGALVRKIAHGQPYWTVAA